MLLRLTSPNGKSYLTLQMVNLAMLQPAFLGLGGST